MAILVFSPNGTYVTKPTLEAARTSADCAGKTVVVTSALTAAQSDITAAWPTDRALKVEKGGSIGNTVAFTINGSFSAALSKVFSGAGLVTFGAATIKEVYPQWFGATGDGVTDDTLAIQTAINSCSSVYIPKGNYKITAELVLNADQHIFGDGRMSRIYTTTGVRDNGINMLMAYEKFNIIIEDITVDCSGFGTAFPPAGTFVGMGIPIGLIGCTTSIVRRCYVFNGGGVTAVPGVNQGSVGIYLSNSRYCQVVENIVQSGQNGIGLDQWYSTLAGGSKASFKLGHNIIESNTVSNMAGRGLAIDDDLTQDGFNLFANNVVSLCSYAGIAASYSRSLTITGNICDGKYTTERTQGTTSAACYYGIKTAGLVNSKIAGNTFANDLINGVFAYDPQSTSFSGNHITPDCTNADPEAIGALGAVCIIATGSNRLAGNKIDNNYIERRGTVGTIPGIMLQIGAVTAAHDSTSISGNSIFKFNGNSIHIPSASTTKAAHLKINDNILNGAATVVGTGGIYVNGVTYSEFLDNSIYAFNVGISEFNGVCNSFTGKVDFCGQGFLHTNLDSDYLALHFTNINAEAIFGTAATIGLTDATACKFTTVGFIKSGSLPAASSGLNVLVYATVVTTGLAGQIAIGGVGDRIINSAPAVAQPKAWICTVAGTPGTWVSEGAL